MHLLLLCPILPALPCMFCCKFCVLVCSRLAAAASSWSCIACVLMMRCSFLNDMSLHASCKLRCDTRSGPLPCYLHNALCKANYIRASDRENAIVYLYTTMLGMAVALEAVQGNAADGCSVFNSASLFLCSCCTCQLHMHVAGDTSVFNGASLRFSAHTVLMA